MLTLSPRVVTKAMSPFVPGKAAPATAGTHDRMPRDTAAATAARRATRGIEDVILGVFAIARRMNTRD